MEEQELTVQDFIDNLGHEYDGYIIFFNWCWIKKNDYYGIVYSNVDDDYSTLGDVLGKYRSGVPDGERIFAEKYRDLYKDMVMDGINCKIFVDTRDQQILVFVFWHTPDVYYGQTETARINIGHRKAI